MKYFTSDLHLHHPFVAALRGYTKPEYAHLTPDELRDHAKHSRESLATMVDWQQHDMDVIDHINELVGPADELYVLGDLSTGGTRSLMGALEQLDRLRVPCRRRHLILGNHDLSRSTNIRWRLAQTFSSVCLEGATTIGKLNVLLSHFQFRHHFEQPTPSGLSTNACDPQYARYAFVDNGFSWLLHGHTHSTDPFEFANPRELNIGVDAWGLRPVSEEQVLWHFADAERLISFPPQPHSTLKRHR